MTKNNVLRREEDPRLEILVGICVNRMCMPLVSMISMGMGYMRDSPLSVLHLGQQRMIIAPIHVSRTGIIVKGHLSYCMQFRIIHQISVKNRPVFCAPLKLWTLSSSKIQRSLNYSMAILLQNANIQQHPYLL